MRPIPVPSQNNEKTNLLIAAVRYAVTGPGYLEHLATEYFQGTEETEMVNSIFDKAATAPSALEEEKESDSLEALDNPKGRTIKDLIRLLLADRKVNVNVQDSTGWPLLFFAVENSTVLAMLFAARPELANTFSTVTAIAGDGANSITWDVFTWSAEKGCVEILAFLANKLPESTPQAKKEKIIRIFLAQDLTQSHNQENFLAVLNAFALPADAMNAILFEAVEANAPLAIQILLKAPNSNVNAVNHWGMTALILAARDGHTDAIRALLAAPDININAVDRGGWKTLMKAARNDQLADIDAPLNAGANVNEVGRWVGQTALMWAAENGHAAAISALLNAGANVNAVGILIGKTALMWAARNGQLAAIDALLNAGADVNVADRWGRTALMEAAENGHATVVTALLAAPTLNLTLHNQARKAIRRNHPECSQLIQAALMRNHPQEGSQLIQEALTDAVWARRAQFVEVTQPYIVGGSLVLGIVMYFWGNAILSTAGFYTGFSFLMNLATYSALTLGVGSFVIAYAIGYLAAAYFAPTNVNVDAYAATDSNVLREEQREQGRRAPTLRFSQAGVNRIAEATNRSVPSMPRQNPRL